MKKLLIFFLILFGLQSGFICSASDDNTQSTESGPSETVYSWTDENGNKHYSNQKPPSNIEEYKKEQIQTSEDDSDFFQNFKDKFSSSNSQSPFDDETLKKMAEDNQLPLDPEMLKNLGGSIVVVIIIALIVVLLIWAFIVHLTAKLARVENATLLKAIGYCFASLIISIIVHIIFYFITQNPNSPIASVVNFLLTIPILKFIYDTEWLKAFLMFIYQLIILIAFVVISIIVGLALGFSGMAG